MYVATETLDEPVYVLIDALINALRNSNGIEFCPPEQIEALLSELWDSKVRIGAQLGD